MRKLIDIARPTIAQKRFEVDRLAEIIEKAYLAQGREPSDRAKKSFAPSGLGYGAGTCPRQWFYAFTGGRIREDDTDAIGIANMALGTDRHEWLQKTFEDTGILVETERKIIGEDPPVFGYADLILNWQGEECVGEIKTTTQESFVSKKAKNKGSGYHLLQVLIYMKVENLSKGFLLYENKSSQELLIIPVTWNEANKELIDVAWEWMRKVYANWQAGTLPERPFKSARSVVCKQCPFKTACWEDEDGTVKIEQLDVPA